MPRVVVISDIHGNVNALQAAWKDITHRRTDHLLFLGDLVAFGPNPCETIDFFKEHIDANVALRGNTDRWLLERVWENDDSGLPQPILDSLKWTASKLGKRRLGFLEKLVDETEYAVDGLDLLLCHASPGSDVVGIAPGAGDEHAKAFKKVKANLVLCGHTHQPTRTRIAGVDVLNVGSVGFPFDGDQRSCYVSFFVGGGRLQELGFSRVSYSLPHTLHGLEESGMPHQDLFAHRLITASMSEPREVPDRVEADA